MRNQPDFTNVAELLHELEASGDWDIEEMLFLSFNANVGFFESGLLGLCRSMGARVSVIVDAGMWNPDPLAMKGAGSEYLLGLASHPAAFHPKLILLVAADKVLAVIGSGNLTQGGWQYNAELWTVLRTDDTHSPAALFDLADWIHDLTAVVGMGSNHRRTLNRIADVFRETLQGLVRETAGPQLVTNLRHSMLSQLPRGPVDEVILTAPFIDERAAAVQAIIRHFEPQELKIIVQHGLTVVEPLALARVLEKQANVSVILDESGLDTGRYRHAKLIEWRHGETRMALTGSANLSAAAMLKPARAGGNVELGLVTFLNESLWPDPNVPADALVTLSDAKEIPGKRLAGSEADRPAKGLPQLLSVLFIGHEVSLELAQPAPVDTRVEYLNNPLIGTWTYLGTIKKNEREIRFLAGALTENTLLRVVWPDHNESYLTGPAVPASNPDRLRLRPARANKSGRRIRSYEDLLGQDFDHLDAFAEQLAQIHDDVRAAKSPGNFEGASARQPNSRQVSAEDEAASPWLWELELVARNIHGPVVASFALGLPSPASGGWEDFDPSERGDLEVDAESLPDNAVEGSPPQEDPPEPLQHRHDPERLKKLRRDRIAGFARMSERMSTLSYLGLTRLTLCFYCAGNWPETDAKPLEYIAKFLSSAVDGAIDTELQTEAAALTAVTLTAVRHRVDYAQTTPLSRPAIQLNELGRTTISSVDDIPEGLIREYTRCLSSVGGRAIEPEDVYEEVRSLSTNSVFDEAVLAAKSHNFEAEFDGPSLLNLHIPSGDPVRAALSVLSESSPPLGVRAFSASSDKSALVLWSNPDLYCIEFGHMEKWTHYRSAQGPRVVLNSIRSSEHSRFRVNNPPFGRTIPDAEALAGRLNISIRTTALVPEGTCPTCYMVLARSGICNNCE